MPSTSVHFPDSLLEELNDLAAETGVSRNRLIVEACRETVEKRREWPPGFFDEGRIRPGDLEHLRAGAAEFERQLAAARQNRKAPPF